MGPQVSSKHARKVGYAVVEKEPEFPRVKLCPKCLGVGRIGGPCDECARYKFENCNIVIRVCPNCDGYGWVIPEEWVQT